MAEKPRLPIEHLPDALYEALGKVAVRYGQLEHVIGLAMKRHDPSRTWEQVFEQLQKLGREAGAAQALENYGVAVMDQKKEGELLAQFDRADALARDRHRVIHAHWATMPGAAGELVGNHNGEPIADKPETIVKLSEDLYEVVVAIDELTSPDATPPGQERIIEGLSAKPFTSLPGSDLKRKK